MIKLVELGILLNKTLIIGDMHIGYEEYLNKKGILVPRFQFAKLKKAIEKLIEQTKPKTVVINGDIKHEFGAISAQEWKETIKIIDLITSKAKLILIKGNHDAILGPIAEKRGVEVKDHCVINGVYICHGHKIPKDNEFKKAKTIIIGHEHPAITLKEDAKQETYKCFLKTKYKNKTIFVLPSFNFVSEGTDITKEKLLSPFLKEAKSAEVIVTHEGRLYEFGKVKLNFS